MENNKRKNKVLVGANEFYEYADELYLTAAKGHLRWKCGYGDVGVGAYDGQYLLRELYSRFKVDAFGVGEGFKGVHRLYYSAIF